MNEDNKKVTSTREGIRPYLFVGLAASLVICSCILFFFVLHRFNIISEFISKVIGILQPIIYGFVIAYLLNPILTFAEIRLLPLMQKHLKKEKTCRGLTRTLSIIFSLVVGCLCIYILGSIIIPELLVSLRGLFFSLPELSESFTRWMTDTLSGNSKYGSILEDVMTNALDYAENFLKTDLLPQLNTWISALATGVIGAVGIITDFFIGIIVSVYVLNGKEKFAAQGKMLIYAIFPMDTANVIIDTLRQSNDIFSSFIVGKIIDSVIIGVLCFIGCSLLKMPYTLLISVFIGVTNVIPFFGPYIGAIPSAILVLFVNPLQCVYFVIFILALQQLDGNIIGPMILGDSTGLSAFWVIFSILLGGGLFGFVGMIVGVPTFAVIYYITRQVASHLLKKKEMPIASADYAKIERITCENGEIKYTELVTPVEKKIREHKEHRREAREKTDNFKDKTGN